MAVKVKKLLSMTAILIAVVVKNLEVTSESNGGESEFSDDDSSADESAEMEDIKLTLDSNLDNEEIVNNIIIMHK